MTGRGSKSCLRRGCWWTGSRCASCQVALHRTACLSLPLTSCSALQQEWKRAVIKGVPLVHRGEVWLVSSQLKGRLLRERASYKSVIAPTTPGTHCTSSLVSFVCHDVHFPPSSCTIHAMHRISFTLFFSHCTPPSLLLFSDARAAISWLALPTPASRAPGASRRPSFARIPQLQRRFSFCFCGSRDEIRLDLHRTFVPLLPPFLPLYCETNCCGQLRRAPGLLHAAGADLVGARASAVKPFPVLVPLPLLCTNAPRPQLLTAQSYSRLLPRSQLYRWSVSHVRALAVCTCYSFAPSNPFPACLLTKRARSGFLQHCAKKCAPRTTAAA